MGIDLLDLELEEYINVFSKYNYVLHWLYNSQDNSYYLAIYKPDNIKINLSVDYINNLIAGKKTYQFTYNDALPKAMGLAKIKNQQDKINILDGTAGFTLDAYALLQLNNNIHITLLEQSKVLYYLVKDGLDRSDRSDQEISSRVKLININFIDYLKNNLNNNFDIIYLDPMFEKSNSTAKPKQNMQLLQDLCFNPNDVNELLIAGLEYINSQNNNKNTKLVLKRNIKQPKLLSKYINYSVASKQVRYDVYRGIINNQQVT